MDNGSLSSSEIGTLALLQSRGFGGYGVGAGGHTGCYERGNFHGDGSSVK